MGRRQWTLLLVSDSETSVRQYRFSRDVVRLGVAVSFVLISAASSATTAFVMKQHAPRQTAALQEKNDLLKAEIKHIRKQVNSLDIHLDELAHQDEQFRLVAGLQPLDADVKKVGIGGPGGPSAENARLRELDGTAGELTGSTADHVGELLRRARLLSFSWREATSTIETKHERMKATPSIVPTEGYLTSSFSRSRWHPILNRPRAHEGVDITAAVGTPIVAAADGRVRRAGYEGDYGYLVEIDHGYGVMTRYAHASKTLVRAGQSVKRGDQIALVGETGLAVGPHLHYEVLVNGKPRNPRNYFLKLDAIVD